MARDRVPLLVFAISLAAMGNARAASPAPTAQSPPSFVLVGATLIDGTGAAALPDSWIHVEGERIRAVGQGAAPSAVQARILDLSGKSVLPGLADMHVHLRGLSQAKWMLKLLLAHGVTNVKETGNGLGNLAAIQKWMKEESPLPHLYVSGATLNGSSRELEFLKEGRSIRSRLDDNAAFGVDFLKIHNFISSQGLKQIVQFANEQDLYLTGHVPLVMNSVAAIDAGMKILEHVRLRPHEVLDDPERIALYPLDLIVMRRTAYWAHLDPDASALRRTLEAWERRKDEFFVDPTLVVQWGLAHADLPRVTEAPELNLISPGLLQRWRQAATRYGDLDAEAYEEAKGSVRGMATFIGLAHSRGIRVLTGTDTPVNWVIPGRSLHQELELLVQAGLSPVEAIHCSTGQAARALRRPDRGTIAAGKLADLVIVDGDVSEDIRSLRNLHQIILGGRIYEHGRLIEDAGRLAREDPVSSDETQN